VETDFSNSILGILSPLLILENLIVLSLEDFIFLGSTREGEEGDGIFYIRNLVLSS
jgi:hypothetical protein